MSHEIQQCITTEVNDVPTRQDGLKTSPTQDVRHDFPVKPGTTIGTAIPSRGRGGGNDPAHKTGKNKMSEKKEMINPESLLNETIATMKSKVEAGLKQGNPLVAKNAEALVFMMFLQKHWESIAVQLLILTKDIELLCHQNNETIEAYLQKTRDKWIKIVQAGKPGAKKTKTTQLEQYTWDQFQSGSA